MTAPFPMAAVLPFSSKLTSDKPRLYCFPYAGGSSSVFAPWSKELAPLVAVSGVDLPGHGSRFKDPLLEDIAAMAASAAQAIERAESQSSQSSGFAFYGHSLGAILAFETARLLTDHCRAGLTHLFAGAARAPGIPSPVPPICHLDDTAFLSAIQGRYGGLPAILFEEPELLAMVLPILRADFQAYETYRNEHGVQLTLPITGFFGEQDTVVTSNAMIPWKSTTSGQFHLHALAGGHFFLNEDRKSLLHHILSTIQASTTRSETSLAATSLPGFLPHE